MISWREFEAAAPAIAHAGARRLEATRIALLGTIRKDGSPRISPVEPFLSEGELVFGAMAWSRKTRDLQRDSRCVLHSAVTAPDQGEPELKLYGRAIEAATEIREACSRGWWQAHPTGSAVVFVLLIEQATLVEWELDEAQMIVRRWSLGDGLSASRRSYP
jgi:hypothetical protein